MRSSLTHGVLFRLGETADLQALCEIDLDAGELFERAGLTLCLPDDHEYSVAERARWLRCLKARTTIIATDMRGRAVGFAAVDLLDGEPYLEQLSVRASYMRRGIGSALIDSALDIARLGCAATIWLTTYAHLPWNRPFYEKHAFSLVPTHHCGPGVRRELEQQRRWLPRPQERIAMRKQLSRSGSARPAIR